MNLYREITRGFITNSDKTLLDCSPDRNWTFADIDLLTARFAAYFARLQLNAAQRVLVQVEKSPWAVALYLACLRRGLVFVPLNTAYTDHEVEYFAADAEPSLVIVDPARSAELQELVSAPVETLDVSGQGSLAQVMKNIEPLWDLTTRRAQDPAAMLYTSGTTGRSKAAVLSNSNLLSNVRTLIDTWAWRRDDVLLHALPIYHVHGLFVGLHCALLGGSTILFMPRFDVAGVCARLARTTVMMGVPTFYTRLLDHPEFNRDICRNMRLFISGSAPLLATTFAEFEARTGHSILERYGMSETNMIASNPWVGARLPGTVGFALNGVSLRIACDEPVYRPGSIGEIQVRGPNVFAGYWRRPDLTNSEFTHDGYFKTGDLGFQDEYGRLTLTGRARDLIISGGLNVYPGEIESHIDEFPGVVESAVVGIDDADFGEQVVACVVAPGKDVQFVTRLEHYLGDRLAKFKRPRKVVLLGELPRNAMGKVQKNVLRKQLQRPE